MKDNISKFPYIKFKQRAINEYGKGYVPCEVSERWIRFLKEISDFRWIDIDIMTKSDGKDFKLCSMIISKEDLMRAINSIELKDSNKE